MSEVKVNKISPRTNCGTVTLGDSGDTFSIPAGVTLTNSGTATGFGPTGAVSWNTTKITADPNPAVSGVGYFADTTSSAFTVTLPAAPSAGDIVALSDYTGTWTTNNLTVGRNSSNINGAASDLILNGNNTTATLIYVDATEGWRVIDTGSLSEVNVPLFVTATGGTETTCGDFKIHTFTGPGTFTVTSAGNPIGSNSVEYLTVAGGGGGGSHIGGAGGGGGTRFNFPSPAIAGLPVTAQGYPITVGAGGNGATDSCGTGGTNGSPSIFSTITSTGGGKGGSNGATGPLGPGSGFPGGAGGGGGHGCGPAGPVGSLGGLGNTPPTSPSQGAPGGTGYGNTSHGGGGGGGGGSAGVTGGAAVQSPTAQGGAGGNGTQVNIDGNNYYWAGGGGGTSGIGPSQPAGTGGNGGLGGGGGASVQPPGTAGNGGGSAINSGGNGGIGTISGAGGTNSGGGGGGGAHPQNDGGAGGSGIVIIRYKFQ
jgi:hypothetical protein